MTAARRHARLSRLAGCRHRTWDRISATAQPAAFLVLGLALGFLLCFYMSR